LSAVKKTQPRRGKKRAKKTATEPSFAQEARLTAGFLSDSNSRVQTLEKGSKPRSGEGQATSLKKNSSCVGKGKNKKNLKKAGRIKMRQKSAS